jgi:hypothetical protein
MAGVSGSVGRWGRYCIRFALHARTSMPNSLSLVAGATYWRETNHRSAPARDTRRVSHMPIVLRKKSILNPELVDVRRFEP